MTAVLGIAAGTLVGWHAGGRARAAGSGELGTVTRVLAGDGGSGVSLVDAAGRKATLAEGATVPLGATVQTDDRTRARVELVDGTVLAIDRDTTVAVNAAHDVEVKSGAIVVDEAGGAPALVVRTPFAQVDAADARFSLAVDDRHANLGVARGDATVRTSSDTEPVSAGEEADVTRADARVRVTAARDIGQRMAFEGDADPHRDGPAPGLGELRARKPGTKDEIDGAVRLARHDVKARIAGSMARTEVDEEFVNTTDKELEGVWRFPLPAGARLERLALEVDGKLVEGEFVDAQRAAGIWRGVIAHAAPTAPKSIEDIVWVPGPWRDPALLEWKRGGAAELRIFPIPPRGTRRVVLAYTQRVEPVAGMRRYVYPLEGRPGAAPIDNASFDVRVVGEDPAVGVQAHGYELTPGARDTAGEGLSMARSPFVPTGDLVVEYATTDRTSAMSAYAFAPPASQEDAFVALALRPVLPARLARRSRDQVVVVDAGRSMFGERLRRASQLAVSLVQQMDRRDRVSVLACDLDCRAMPGGWLDPGAAAAHAVDAFLAGTEADGASDLAGAVRSAAQRADRDPARDLRVVLLSDGIVSAGYRDAARVEAAVKEALPDAQAAVVAVPIGSEADVDALGAIARGGGGAVVPYAPGQPVDVAALDVLTATYGATLRDAELVLPEGLSSAAPAALAPIRAGSETLVAARMRGDHVSGDVVLRGTVAGEPFEARWPLDVRATGDDGNAWIPRAWAAERIADDERDPAPASRDDAAALSRRFHVPSRFTSLLVLESEAMFHAFGIGHSGDAFAWTGETEAQGTDTAADDTRTAAESDKDAYDPYDAAPKKAAGAKADDEAQTIQGPVSFVAQGGGGAAGAIGEERSRMNPVAPAATMPAPAPPPPRPHVSAAPVDGPWLARRARPGRWMRRVWFRTAAVGLDARPVVDSAKLQLARAALDASPDLRQRSAELGKLLVRQGDADDLDALAARWGSRDPLDPDLLSLRAAARAWKGDRDGELRVLSGTLASPAVASKAQADFATALARAEERAGRPDEACTIRVFAAEAQPDSPETVGAAVACERARGRDAAADRWLASLKDDAARQRAVRAAQKIAATRSTPDTVFGDIVLDATWDASDGADLDLAVIDPAGRRLAWASGARNVRARDCTSTTHESLGVSSFATGAFAVEVVRADAGADAAPVRGTLRITSLGSTRTVPFVVSGSRAQVGRVDVHLESRLEALD